MEVRVDCHMCGNEFEISSGGYNVLTGSRWVGVLPCRFCGNGKLPMDEEGVDE